MIVYFPHRLERTNIITLDIIMIFIENHQGFIQSLSNENSGFTKGCIKVGTGLIQDS